MKNLLIILALVCLAGTNTFAGSGEPTKAKTTTTVAATASAATVKSKADSIKAVFAAQGFTVVKEASIKMESEYEFPVIVPLNKGTWYHVVFVGEEGSKLYEMRMYDYDEKQVVYEKNLAHDKDANIISYSYIPKFSEYHMLKPVVVNKKKKNEPLDGYIMLLKKVS